MTNSRDRPAETRLRAHQQEYQDYLLLTERIQAQLRDDIDILKAQEGWDAVTAKGVDEWVDDLGAIWRALRRHRYDPEKTLSALLATLTHRVSLSLHGPPPSSSPYASSPLFYILPLSQFTTRLGQPVVVITLREVRRDGPGGLEEMKEWTWWALEMVRRVLKGWWIDSDFDGRGKGKGKRKVRGYGGEGCVLMIDAEGAGYRNLEVELLPTLLSVGHNHFPGVFDSVHVVNAGWTHRSMWTVVKRILPKSALEKVDFLDTPQALEAAFDLDRLPSCYGGSDSWTFSPESNTILQYCSRPLLAPPTPHPPSISPDALASRSTSSTSLADVFYTAANTPISSRPATRVPSRRGSISGPGMAGLNALNDFRMTNLRRTRSNGHTLPSSSSPEEDGRGKKRPYGRRPSVVAQLPGMTPLQRIKSLSDFHLYLSPSRLANLDLLSDSESDSDPATPMEYTGDDTGIPTSPPVVPAVQVRKVLRPVVVDPEATISLRSRSLAERRIRPPLRLHGVGGVTGDNGDVRSYSDRLSLHHAHILREYQKSPPPIASAEAAESGETAEKPSGTSDSAPSAIPDTSSDPTPPPSSAQPTQLQRVSAYSRSLNPWFGYPALRLSHSPNSTHIIPLYPRNRKRDLIKTLLFLFMLRLQSARDTVERSLGLHHLGAVPWNRRWEGLESKGPDEGLRALERRKREGKGGEVVMGMWGGWKKRGEWVWMIICLVLLRGGWTRVLAGLVGLGWGGGGEGIREVLGWG